MSEVWGYDEGLCAWCLTTPATKQYIGEMAGGELATYNVCDKCYLAFAPDNQLTIWDKEKISKGVN